MPKIEADHMIKDIIEAQEDYNSVLSRIEVLMDAEEGTPEIEELKRLVTLVESYEGKHYPIDPADTFISDPEKMAPTEV